MKLANLIFPKYVRRQTNGKPIGARKPFKAASIRMHAYNAMCKLTNKWQCRK